MPKPAAFFTDPFTDTGAAVVDNPSLVYKREFGDEVSFVVKTPWLAFNLMAWMAVTADAPGLVARYTATAPATIGDAMDDPLRLAVAVSPEAQSETIWFPGAKRSTHAP